MVASLTLTLTLTLGVNWPLGVDGTSLGRGVARGWHWSGTGTESNHK